MNVISFFTIICILIGSLSVSSIEAIEREPSHFYLPGETSSEKEVRLHNISLMHNVLRHREYNGYDIIIISSTTEEEADYQQQLFESAFAGTSTAEGKTPIILSVVDLTDGGQLIGALFTWLKAEEKMVKSHARKMDGCLNLLEYVRNTGAKVAVFHNGGKGERFSPMTQSLGNSRGSQKLVGYVTNAYGEKIELEVLLGVVLQCSQFASTNAGTHIDTYWTSQIAFGSKPHDQIIRSNFGIDKFLVGFDKARLDAQNLTDFGTAALSGTGRMLAFYGNKRFAARQGDQYVVDRQKVERELLAKGDKVAYDFGSFSCSHEMWQLLIDYWVNKGVFEDVLAKEIPSTIKRDIDPHFIQPMIRLIYGINDLADKKGLEKSMLFPSTLADSTDFEIAREIFNEALRETAPEAYAYIYEEVNLERDPKKKKELLEYLNEVIELYLSNHLSPVFENLEKIFGCIDLGDNTQWFRYRRSIDILNEKLEMLIDMMGSKAEVQLNGNVHHVNLDDKLLERCFESRVMRGIDEREIAKFSVEGKEFILPFSEMKNGVWIEDVYIKNSIIQNCDLSKGSQIINSVLNNVSGRINANYAYIESATAPFIEAFASVIHEAVDHKGIIADREVVSDVYRTIIEPPYHGRMRAPIGFDPKGMQIYKMLKDEKGSMISSHELSEVISYFVKRIPYDIKNMKEYSDETARTDDGLFTFDQIRRIHPVRIADKQFRDSLNRRVKDLIIEQR